MTSTCSIDFQLSKLAAGPSCSDLSTCASTTSSISSTANTPCAMA